MPLFEAPSEGKGGCRFAFILIAAAATSLTGLAGLIAEVVA